MTSFARLDSATWETRRHLATLGQALADWQSQPRPPWAEVEADMDQVRLLDQILYRFMKLQDAVGERLLPATLAELLEPYEDWPMRDRLDRMERLGYLDATQWLAWRGVRHRLAHGYPDAPELRWAALEDALAAATALMQCAHDWLGKLPNPDAASR